MAAVARPSEAHFKAMVLTSHARDPRGYRCLTRDLTTCSHSHQVLVTIVNRKDHSPLTVRLLGLQLSNQRVLYRFRIEHQWRLLYGFRSRYRRIDNGSTGRYVWVEWERTKKVRLLVRGVPEEKKEMFIEAGVHTLLRVLQWDRAVEWLWTAR